MSGLSVVVIGASEGGVDALRRLVAGIDSRAPAAWCVVLHTDARPSYLPGILAKAGHLPADHPRQGQQLSPGRIYVAPPDYHLVIKDGAARLSRGPRVNWTRPAIDPLFCSAAEYFGARTIGVILTGNLNDGTLGLHEIRRRGGLAVVQDPMEAESPGMPTSALAQAGADHCVALAEMPGLLCRLAAEVANSDKSIGIPSADVADGARLARPEHISCPDCGGAMARDTRRATPLYRCHVGHALTPETVLHAKHHALEAKLGACLAILNERAELCRFMNETGQYTGREASVYEALRAQSLEQADAIRKLLESDWVRPGD